MFIFYFSHFCFHTWKKTSFFVCFFPHKIFFYFILFFWFSWFQNVLLKKYFWLWKPESSEEKKSAWKRSFMFKQSFFYSYFQENFVSSCVKPKLNEKIMEKIIKFHSVEIGSFVCEKNQTVCSFSRIFFSWNCFLHMFSLIEKWLRSLKRLSG